MLLSLLLVGVVVAVPNSQPNAPFNVNFSGRQILKRGNGDANPLYVYHLNETLKKYNSNVQLPTYPAINALLGTTLKKRGSNGKLTDQVENGYVDLEYYIPIKVNQQDFLVDFDTGSSDIFVPGPNCDKNAGCSHSTKYNQRGTDRGTTTTVTYGSGKITGENYLDNVTMAGLTAQKQALISLTQAKGFSLDDPDGLVGMAFKSLSASKSASFFENLIAQKQVTVPEFSVYLGRALSNTDKNSELTLGGRDASKFTGTPTLVPVTVARYWQVALDTVNVNGMASPQTKGQAIIDTGTTLILAPTMAAFSIFLNIPGAVPIPLVQGSQSVTVFAYPCDTDPKYIPVIQFAGALFTIDPLDFNYGQLTQEFAESIGSTTLMALLKKNPRAYCLSAISTADLDVNQNLYIIGDTFLKSWYSIYSYTAAAGGKPAVLFAKSVKK